MTLDADTTADVPQAGSPAPTPATVAAQHAAAQQDADTQQNRQESAEQTIERLTRELRDARQEAGRSRVTAKQTAADEREKEVVAKLLTALGVNSDGSQQVNADDLARQLEAARQETRDLKLREAVREHAPGDVDPSRVLTYTPFWAEVGDIDPTDTKAIEAAIATVVGAAPWLRKTPAAPQRSGTEMTGAGSTEVTQARFNSMSGAERNALFISDPDTYRRLSGT